MQQRSIKKNMIINVGMKLINYAFPLLTLKWVTNRIYAEGLGHVSFVQSVLQYFILLSTLGVPTFGVKLCAQDRYVRTKLSEDVKGLFKIEILCTVLSYIILFALVFLIPEFREESRLFVAMCPIILLNVIGLDFLFEAVEDYAYIAKKNIIIKVLSLLLVIIFVSKPSDYIVYGFISTTFFYLANLFNLHYSKQYIDWNTSSSSYSLTYLKPVLVLFAASAAISIYSQFDSLMLGFMSGAAEVGYYSVALKVKTLIVSLASAISAVIIPRASIYAKSNDPSNYIELLKKSLFIIQVTTIPASIMMLAYPKDIVLLLANESFLSSVPTIRVLALCSLVLSLTGVFGNQVLIPLGLEKRYSQSVIVGLFINLILNCILIPTYGSFGAAIGTFVTEVWNLCWMSGGVKSIRKKIMTNKWLVATLSSSVIGTYVSYSIGQYINFSGMVFLDFAIKGILFYLVYLSIIALFYLTEIKNFIKN